MAKKHMPRQHSTKAEVQEFLSGHTPAVRSITFRLRKLVLDVAPDSLEQIDRAAHLLGYGYAPTYRDTVCVILPLKGAVSLGFPRGVDLPDPAGLLEGAGKRARHVKLAALEDVDAPALRTLLEAAVALTKG